MSKTNTATELNAYVGKKGLWDSPLGVKIPVLILDARKAYGRFELKVTPISGSGEVWARNVKIQTWVDRGTTH